MVDKDAAGVVIAVNGQVPDGEDLSWLWDVRFEHFENTAVGCGRRTRHRPRRAVGVRRGPAHPGTRHHGGDRVVSARTGRGGGQLHGISAVAAQIGPSWLTRPYESGWCCPT